MRTVVVIPAFNEERTVGAVIQRVREHIPDVLVIDDGSTDSTSERARNAGATVVRHAVNRGLGAALGTGLAACFSLSRREGELEGVGDVSENLKSQISNLKSPDILITLDADGQHDPADIPTLIAPIERGEADVVIGTRFGSGFSPSRREGELEGVGSSAEAQNSKLKTQNNLKSQISNLKSRGTPWSRIAANRTANLVTRALFGVRCTDTQSGFRALSRHAAEHLDLRTNRMEVSSEILAEAARLHLRITEVPIRTIYTEYSLSKGQSPTVGVRTAWGLVMRRLL